MAMRAYISYKTTKEGRKYWSGCWSDDRHNRTDWYRHSTDAVIALTGGKTKHIEKLGLLTDLDYKEEFNDW